MIHNSKRLNTTILKKLIYEFKRIQITELVIIQLVLKKANV